MRSGCTARLWLRWWRCRFVLRLPGREGSMLLLPQATRLLRGGLKGHGLRLRGSSPAGRRLRSGPTRKCKGGRQAVSFSGPVIRELRILMRDTHGRDILLAPRRGLLTVPRRMQRRLDHIPIRARRLRGIWATGSISTAIFRCRTRNGFCATTRASGGFRRANRTGWCSSCTM